MSITQRAMYHCFPSLVWCIFGGDSRADLAHSAVVTAANVHDKHPLLDLLHGGEERYLRRQWLKFMAYSAFP
jgi:IS5 family transposase